MRYSIELRERRYVEGYGFLSFARNLNNKYGQKPMILQKNLQQMHSKFPVKEPKKLLKKTGK